MPPSPRKTFALFSIIAVLLIALLLVVWRFYPDSDDAARRRLLQLAPPEATALIFLDARALSSSPFLGKLYAWAAHPKPDSEYIQFVRETGFSYERDLKRVVIAISNQGSSRSVFAIADGKFHRKKIEAFFNRNGDSSQQGKWKIFRLNAPGDEKPLFFVFLADNRIAAGNCEDFPGLLSGPGNDPSRAEWNARFERLAGVPVFAVIRQNAALQAAWGSAAAGSFDSPQLSRLLAQLQWISIAGKPDGDQLRVVADGESVSPSVTAQLGEFLQGVQLLAQTGLNDPNLREKMAPEQRQAYLQILRSAEVQKIDRGDWKSVRLMLEITPQFLDIARQAASAPAPEQAPADPPNKNTTPAKTETRKKK